ncbi:DUF2399 domain-containing protein [Streptomyces sp. NPDC051994]|uniref:DUF2399 domain-containing protein n=1 Tax=unclassified Streptomyces TaxID=2593676 RepID=UPI00342C34C1
MALHGRRLPNGSRHATTPVPLSGSPADSPWEPGRARALTDIGHCVEEEAVLDTLLADLG